MKPLILIVCLCLWMSHPAWVRGLKRLSTATDPARICRTPRGCVD